MKHNLRVTGLLILFFFLSQLFGLFALSYDMKQIVDTKTNQTVIKYSETAVGQRPDIQGGQAIIYLGSAILIGTTIILILAKFRKKKLWKIWFFLAIWMTISITLGIFIKNDIIYLFALIIAILKIYKPNFYTHNFSEVLVYTGIAFLLVPLLNIFWASIMLLLISVYDAIAVWQSKHMIKLALFQQESKVFAGLNINYKKNLPFPKPSKSINKSKIKEGEGKMASAILGGGDIAFPLIFAGTILSFFFNSGVSKLFSFLITLPVILFSGIGLSLLLYMGKHDKFYPAMPFISVGCFLGLGISMLLFFL